MENVGNYKQLIVFAILCFMLFLSCQKEVSRFELPPITNEGKGTFGCKVNGNLFLPTGLKGNINVEYYSWKLSPEFYGNFYVTVFRSNENHQLEYCQFAVPKCFGVGEYIINRNDTLSRAGCSINNLFYKDNCGSGDICGKIIINRYDTIQRIISGTFDFRCKKIDFPTATAYVTDGRFDLKY